MVPFGSEDMKCGRHPAWLDGSSADHGADWELAPAGLACGGVQDSYTRNGGRA